MAKSFYNNIFFFAQILYLIVLCLFWAIPYWPKGLWWLANLLEIVPLWVLFVPLGLFVLTGSSLKSRTAVLISAASFLIILFGIMGFKLSIPTGKVLSGPGQLSLTVITANMGNVTDTELFLELVANERPDVIAFQELDPEFRDLLRAQLNANEWDWSTEAGLVLASRFKIRSRQAKNRKPFGGWGDIVAKYELTTPAGPVYFFVVHLATPRDGVEAFMARQRDAITEMQRVTTLQAQESSLAASFASPYKPALVAGDFNMLDTNPLFKAYWSKYRDTFSEKGFGFGYTKHTRWHGARIDHILHDPDWQTLEARVGPDIGGDHHPTIARLILSK